MIFRVVGLALVFCLSKQLPAEIIYSNIATDTNTGVDFTNEIGQPLSEVGDQISLSGTERTAQVARVQFLPFGADGTFQATLRFYNAGPSAVSPVGTQIGSAFSVTNIMVDPSEGAKNVDFLLGGLLLPDDVVFTLAVSNVTSGLSLGMSLFSGPTVGRSDNTYLISRSGGGVFSRSTSLHNLYFELSTTATAVPEPLTFPLLAIGFAATAFAKRRKLAVLTKASPGIDSSL